MTVLYVIGQHASQLVRKVMSECNKTISCLFIYFNLYDSFEYKDNEAIATTLKWKHHEWVTKLIPELLMQFTYQSFQRLILNK